jgi:hypothetical protein
MIYYVLENINIQNTKLFAQIVDLINSVPQNERNSKALVIKLENITEYKGDSPLLKLTFQEN